MTRHRGDDPTPGAADGAADGAALVARRRRLRAALDVRVRVRRTVVVWSPRARIAAWTVTRRSSRS